MNSETIVISILAGSWATLCGYCSYKCVTWMLNKIPKSESRQQEGELPEVKFKLTTEQSERFDKQFRQGMEDSYILSKKEHEAIGRALANSTTKIN